MEVDRRRQRGTGLLPLAGGDIQPTEAQVAVALERAHAQRVGPGKGLLEGGFGLGNMGRVASRVDLAEETQGICLQPLVLVRTGECQRLCGEGLRLLQVASLYLRLPKGETTERLIASSSHRHVLLQRPRE